MHVCKVWSEAEFSANCILASSATNQTGCNKLRSLLKFAWIPLVASEAAVIKMTILRFLKWKKEEVV